MKAPSKRWLIQKFLSAALTALIAVGAFFAFELIISDEPGLLISTAFSALISLSTSIVILIALLAVIAACIAWISSLIGALKHWLIKIFLVERRRLIRWAKRL